MAKAKRLIYEKLKLVDLIVEIVDARIPISSRNPNFLDAAINKPRIIVLNKCDLADENMTEKWVLSLKTENNRVFCANCKLGKGLERFVFLAKDLLKKTKNDQIRAVICGIPNVGKSSFINKMVGKRKAKVENRPAVTQSVGWFRMKRGVDFLDTPGILWPKFENPKIGENLAMVGSIKHSILDNEALAIILIEFLMAHYKDSLENRFKTDFSGFSADRILNTIGQKRGALLSGGKINTKRAADTILEEFRNSKLGRITLEKI
jgi:ribosome biogenesis GTPase A